MCGLGAEGMIPSGLPVWRSQLKRLSQVQSQTAAIWGETKQPVTTSICVVIEDGELAESDCIKNPNELGCGDCDEPVAG